LVARQLGQPPINLITLAEFPHHNVGIRPEDIDPTGGQHEGRVLVVEDAGPVSILLVKWLGFEIHMFVERSRLTPRVGDAIFPSVRPDRIILWPRENS
jgi:hypothetical protein